MTEKQWSERRGDALVYFGQNNVSRDESIQGTSTMTDQYKIYTIAADPLRYEPIRAEDGSERVFTYEDGQAWMCEQVEKLGGLTMTNAETPPSNDALRQLPNGSVWVSYPEIESGGPAPGEWAAQWESLITEIGAAPTLQPNYHVAHRTNDPWPKLGPKP